MFESVSRSLWAGRTAAAASIIRLAFGDDVLNLLPLAIQLLLLVLRTSSSSLATVRHLHAVLERRSVKPVEQTAVKSATTGPLSTALSTTDCSD